MIRSSLLCGLGLGMVAWIGSTAIAAGRVSNGYHDADLELVSPVPDSTGTLDFAISVAVNNGVALVGASGEYGTGRAHIYDSHTGDLLRTLAPVAGDLAPFGRHVALNDSYALVSSWNGTYVYDSASYDLLHILPVSPRNLSGSQGMDVDLGHAVIADRGGGVFVFDLKSGNQLASFGGRPTSVAISGDQVIMGDMQTSSVLVNDWTRGTQLFDLRPERLPQDSNFGISVAADKGRLIIGATGVSTNDVYSAGSAHIFDLTDGELIHRVEGSRTRADSLFGTDVAIEGNVALVSAPWHGDTLLLAGPDHELYESYEGGRGAAYAFAVDSGEELRRFTTLGPLTQGWARYGFSIDYDGQQIIAGTTGWPKKAYLTTFLVPEPQSFGLLIAASGCVCCLRRRRRAPLLACPAV